MTRPRVLVVSIAAGVLLLACAEGRNVGVSGPDGSTGVVDGGLPDASGGSDGGGEPVFPGIEVSVQEDPLALTFIYKSAALARISGGALSGFYLADGTNRISTSGPVSRSTENGAVVLAVKTDDGRDATVTLRPETEDAVSVGFFVHGKTAGELLGVAFAVDPTEGFYGMMEKTVQGVPDDSWRPGMTEGFDLRGQEVFLWVMPAVSVYSPFYVSSAGYGVWAESFWPGTYDFGKDDASSVTIEYEGPGLTLRVFPGPTPLNVTERYARTVGTTTLPPKWVFGPMRWRDEAFNLRNFYDGTPNETPFNSMVAEDLVMITHFGVKNSYYLVDRPWAGGAFGYDDFTWDELRFPNFKRMIEHIHERGMKFILWICPWAVGDLEDEATEKGYIIENPFAGDPGKLLDLSNPEVVDWWQAHLLDVLADGVDGFKLDRGDEKPPDGEFVKGKYSDGMDFREGHNRYPLLYAKAVRGALDRTGRPDLWAFERPAWTGTAQYLTTYGGDIEGREWALRAAIIAQQRTAALNFPIWGSDTCGYFPQSDHEVCMRWLAFSAFSPFMDVGPTANLGFWSRMPGGQTDDVFDGEYDFEPEYDEGLIAAWIMYANLHHDLMDYTYAQAEVAHEVGTPIVRPMIFVHPDRPEFRDTFEQYYYGPDILVAPTWKKGTTERQVQIPDGEWIDAWTGHAAAAGSITVEVPEHKIPIYYRSGSGLETVFGDLTAKWAEAQARAKNRPDLKELQKGVK
ncbi:MAG: glycoside hydrolase family 31 protein [Deltaproteobacteria bacterium]|nr:glycoside hydrolase family 31 protein [Deltaproteobacteria bacterium]